MGIRSMPLVRVVDRRMNAVQRQVGSRSDAVGEFRSRLTETGGETSRIQAESGGIKAKCARKSSSCCSWVINGALGAQFVRWYVPTCRTDGTRSHRHRTCLPVVVRNSQNSIWESRKSRPAAGQWERSHPASGSDTEFSPARGRKTAGCGSGAATIPWR